jgi:signal peptidase I
MPVLARSVRAARRTIDVLLVALIAAVLVAVVLARGLPLLTGGTSFVVAGGSMEPAIPIGSVVLDTPVDAEDLRPGDIVSLQTGSAHAVFTHRIVRIVALPDGLYVETRGDANPAVDPSLVSVRDVIGRVTVSVPYAGFGVALLSSIQGVLFVLSLAALLLVAAWLLESLEDDLQAEGVRRQRWTGPVAPDHADAEAAA